MPGQFGNDFLSQVMDRAKMPIGEFLGGVYDHSKDAGRFGLNQVGLGPVGMPRPGDMSRMQTMQPYQQQPDASWTSIQQAITGLRTEKLTKAATEAKKAAGPTPYQPTQYGQPGAPRADVDEAGIHSGKPAEFVPAALAMARQALAEKGLPEHLAPIMVGIAANETGYGNPRYSGGNRFFGIKGPGTGEMPTEEVIGGRRVTVSSSFRTYDSPLDSFRGFLDFLEQNPRYSGALQQTGDPRAFISAVHQAGYATDPAWTQKVLNIANTANQYERPAAQAQAAQPPQGQPNVVWSQGVSQNELGLDPRVAATFCGPAAVMNFMNAYGRPPNLEEALNLAKQVGWNTSAGMSRGPTSVVEMINRLGGNATQQGYYRGAENKVRDEILQGRPVLVDTPGHYFQVVGYDTNSQRFILGDAVGRQARGGVGSLQEIANLGYGAPRILIMRGD
jgi:flagellum-specific peptidoglycan hydrolase FlgJ